MDVITRYAAEIFHLFFPERCPACGKALPEGVSFLCPACQWEMPLTGYCTEHDNPVARKFWGLVPIEEASSLFFFSSHSPYRNLIHNFKYRGQWRVCEKMGIWFGKELRESGLYDTVDLIVPVPLHPRRLLLRGYNQSEYIARGIAASLGKHLEPHCLIRKRYNRSQTKTHSRKDRWENVSGIFSVRHPERLEGKHILLVDDVLTTGSTLTACAETLLKHLSSCRISIATLAVSLYELSRKKKKKSR